MTKQETLDWIQCALEAQEDGVCFIPVQVVESVVELLAAQPEQKAQNKTLIQPRRMVK